MKKTNFFLRISVVPNCNLRCWYCNPKGMYGLKQNMSNEELVEIIKAAFMVGIRDVHWTGGEPTLRKGLVDVIREARKIGIQNQSMTTNGLLFGPKADDFKKAGLTRVNISLDSLVPKKFEEITGVKGFNLVYDAIVKSCTLFSTVKINTVIAKNNVDEMEDFVRLPLKLGNNLIVRFLELQPHGPAFEENSEMFKQNYVSKKDILDSLKKIDNLEEINKGVVGNNLHIQYWLLKDMNVKVGIVAPYYDGWPCFKECRRIRIGPGGRAKICVMDKKNYELKGLSYQGKLKTFREVVKERKRWDSEDLFPAKHVPAFNELRFGRVD